MADFNIELYSDGGGEKSGVSAAGSIVKLPGGESYKCVSFLGGATNNEAEIFSGLVGFALIELFGGGNSPRVRWVSDSEYVLKSATEYIKQWQRNGWKTAAKKAVKNQGLWQSYLVLSRHLEIIPEHVRGHSGHPENEACDQASTWARSFGEEMLRSRGEGVVVDINSSALGAGWTLLDARGFLEQLRAEIIDAPRVCTLLTDRLAQVFAGSSEKQTTMPF